MDSEILRTMRKAVKSGDLAMVKELISTHDGIENEITGFGTWLHVACSHGQFDLVKYFVENGLDVNIDAGIGDRAAICIAAYRGRLDIVKYLYKNGAKLDTSLATRNPLFDAISGDHLDVAKYLVEEGIDLTVGYDIGSLRNADACEFTRQNGRREIQAYLMEKLGRK